MGTAAWTPVNETAAQWTPVQETQQPSWLDREIPLTSYGAAMESGAQSIARGTRDAVLGTISAFDPRAKDEHEQAVVKAAGSPTILPLYRIMRSLGHTAEDSLQLAGAIHDINQSGDPLGTYLRVAQEVSGQGAGQALTALATEGAVKAAPPVAKAVGTAAKETAGVVRDLATPENIATAAGGAIGSKVGAMAGAPFEGAATGGYIGRQIGKAVAKRLVKGGTEALDATRENVPFAGETEPAASTPTPKSATPANTVPASPKVTQAQVETQLRDALGAPKPPEPGKPIAQRPTAAAKPATPAEALPEVPTGFKAVKSSVLKGYKYDPASHEFEAITNTGQRYRAGEVTPEQFEKFESADSKGQAWNELRKNSTPLGKFVNGKFEPYTKPGLRSADPNAEATEEQPQPRTLKNLSGSESAPEDLTAILQKSVEQAKAGGVPTTIDPATLTKRWGVDEGSLRAGRAQTRGMSATETEADIAKLAERYKKGEAVDPVIETRDADNNIIEVDGRARAIAAKRAGVKRIPIIVRRARAATAQ